jgi:hypothetical protein
MSVDGRVLLRNHNALSMPGIFGLKSLSMNFLLSKSGVETFLAAATLKAWVSQQPEVNGQYWSRN